jgi:hypothetical protein
MFGFEQVEFEGPFDHQGRKYLLGSSDCALDHKRERKIRAGDMLILGNYQQIDGN